MDEKGFISVEYLFSIFIILIIASGLLFFTSASIMSEKNIEENVNHRLILDNIASSISQVNSNGEGYSMLIDLDSKSGFYEVTVEKDRLTIEFSNKKGETLILPLNIDSRYKLYSGNSYRISKTEDGKVVIS
ncbi:hypothetical protein [uncultured Methanobrevibacter sp.]|uniref:hypothetical protein n=1 Tax=uncultured Methanobrevibacter sp. TaxID=253161 RepID=UPI00262C27BD|nr:hypothetical protein [uncultured Methanobrevibacter sp.]